VLDERFVQQKLGLLIARLDELESLSACTLKEYKADHVKRYAVERLIELIVEYATDINRHIVEVMGVAPPQTYYSTFEELGNLGIIPHDAAARLGGTTGLRNRLVHGYEKVSHEIVYHSLEPLLRYYRQYVGWLDAYLSQQRIP
jgi:uncharacterized protein YutE (UPF0331/DUF86 family)